MRLRLKRASLVLVIGHLVAGCATGTGASPSPEGIPGGTAEVRPSPTVPAGETSVPLASPVASPPIASTPTARPELEATDPATVDLSSGAPTLVEFFAFW